MKLNESKGNMYGFITHTGNVIKGKCPHDCSYCYMKKWKQKPPRLDEKELKVDTGTGKFIFVGSSIDMFADAIPEEWIIKTLKHCFESDNKYFFQTKNPANIRRILPHNSSVCVTLETNRDYPNIMNNCPQPGSRVYQMQLIRHPLHITIEPIIDFDLYEFSEMIRVCNPIQVNIGADSQRHNLPEPEPGKVLELIAELEKFTIVHQKSNLKRLLNT